jgi:hypothetical protein
VGVEISYIFEDAVVIRSEMYRGGMLPPAESYHEVERQDTITGSFPVPPQTRSQS